MTLHRGEVYWADLRPRSGSEQSGRRPVVVVSHAIFNESASWKSVIVVPLSTSESQRARAATVVLIPRRSAGLPASSVAVCHQVTTLDRSKLKERIGRLPDDYMGEIARGLKLALQLDEFA
jgi:mRNA interferase MazF